MSNGDPAINIVECSTNKASNPRIYVIYYFKIMNRGLAYFII